MRCFNTQQFYLNIYLHNIFYKLVKRISHLSVNYLIFMFLHEHVYIKPSIGTSYIRTRLKFFGGVKENTIHEDDKKDFSWKSSKFLSSHNVIQDVYIMERQKLPKWNLIQARISHRIFLIFIYHCDIVFPYIIKKVVRNISINILDHESKRFVKTINDR